MASLNEIRSRLAASTNRTTTTTGGGDNSIFPFWNIEEGKTATVRLLPDANPKNTFFWVERAMIRLEFPNIKGDSDSKRVTVRVPCVEMWNDTCPILTEVRTWFKDKSLEEMGRKYWKKRDYFFQGFVRENPLDEESTPENPIRRLIIGPQIFNIIKSALMDPELEELPTDYLRGLDFRIIKGSKGGYSDYGTSTWARKETALSASEQAVIDTYGLYDLSTFLPKKPSEIELKVMTEMFEASVDGQSYDLERWGQYFRPPGVSAPNGEVVTEVAPIPKVQPKPAPVSSVVEDDTPFDTEPAPPAAPKVAAGSSKAEDILAMIRERQKSV